MATSFISLQNVVKRYPMPGAPPVEVLRCVNLDVDAGESVAITGPSGSGKTTLLQLLGLLDVPDEGVLSFAGQDLSALEESQRQALRSEYIGFVFQLHHLLPQLTVLENVLVPAWATGHADEHLERAHELLERMGLLERCDHRPAQLSGGERQRVALVRALLLRPALLLADEPTGSLDHAGATALADLLVEINQADGITLITVTHSRELAARLSRRMRLQDGVLRKA
ncbi:MAG: ABC transporter ATP-binding protein [Kiritimatiellia bacterium]